MGQRLPQQLRNSENRALKTSGDERLHGNDRASLQSNATFSEEIQTATTQRTTKENGSKINAKPATANGHNRTL